MDTHETRTHHKSALPLYAVLSCVCACVLLIANMFVVVIADARARMVADVAQTTPRVVADVVAIADGNMETVQQFLDTYTTEVSGIVSLLVVIPAGDTWQYGAVHDPYLSVGDAAVITEYMSAARALAGYSARVTREDGYIESVYAFDASSTTPAGYVQAVFNPALVGAAVERNMVRTAILTLTLLVLLCIVVAWFVGTGRHHRSVRAAARARREAQQLIEQTLHDVQTPATVITGYVHLLESEELTPSGKVHLNRIAEAVTGLTRFTEQVALAAKLDAGQVPCTPQTVQPQQLVHTVIASVSKRYASRAPRITHTVRGTSLMYVDEFRVQGALEQVLSNAVLHGASPISVSISAEGSDVCITVRDSGPGMDTDTQEQVQKKWTRTRHTGAQYGSGLGLWIAHKLLTGSGGKMNITSAVGKSTVVTIRVPRAITTSQS